MENHAHVQNSQTSLLGQCACCPISHYAILRYNDVGIEKSHPDLKDDWIAKAFPIRKKKIKEQITGKVIVEPAKIDPNTLMQVRDAVFEYAIVEEAEFEDVTELPEEFPASAGWELVTVEEYEDILEDQEEEKQEYRKKRAEEAEAAKAAAQLRKKARDEANEVL